MSKILVVDDESGIRDIIKQYLEFEKFDLAEASNGQEALDIFNAEKFDLVIMDVMMPYVDGITALRMIRENSNVPVILLTAKGEEYDKVFGFDLGADDYVVKPFSPKELMSRVKAILKRSEPKEGNKPKVYQYKDLEVNITSHCASIDGQALSLTPKEFEVLVYFIEQKGVVLKREILLNEIWGYDFVGDSRTVDTHIKMLRNNLGKHRDLIKTVWGVGYRYDEQ